MRHEPHLIAKWREPRVDRNPVGIDFRKVMGVADIERCAALRDHRHPERARLARESGPVVVSPKRRGWQIRMQLPRYFGLRERILVEPAWGRDHDSIARDRQRLDILCQHAARWSGRKRLARRPRQGQSSTSSYTVLQKISSRYRHRRLPPISLRKRANEDHI